MVINIWENGKIIQKKEMEDIYMQMEIYMMENLKKVKEKEKDYILLKIMI